MIPKPRLRKRRELVLLLAAAAMAGCATPPTPAPPPVAPVAPAAPEPAPAPTPAPVVEVPVSMSPQEIQRALASVLDLLQDGQEEQAEAALKKILQADPNNRQALSLMRQIRDDPVAMLGRESFAYKVPSGESLSRIAQRFLNDVQLFYVLARYNNIKVPRTLAGGQTIRVPGRAPPVGPTPPAPAPAPAPAAAPPAPVAAPAPTAPPPSVQSTAAQADKQKADAIARNTKAARGAFAKQDLDGALRNWDAVLALDPENRTAIIERQKILALKEKLGKVK